MDIQGQVESVRHTSTLIIDVENKHLQRLSDWESVVGSVNYRSRSTSATSLLCTGWIQVQLGVEQMGILRVRPCPDENVCVRGTVEPPSTLVKTVHSDEIFDMNAGGFTTQLGVEDTGRDNGNTNFLERNCAEAASHRGACWCVGSPWPEHHRYLPRSRLWYRRGKVTTFTYTGVQQKVVVSELSVDLNKFGTIEWNYGNERYGASFQVSMSAPFK
ncbi:hypothetical protein C8J57DRAFT_1244954 [Mycena rebaudengoi]|nr:hypothetical protein C8J57DRAFT_1244954 [Mycena rebaudengoi]